MSHHTSPRQSPSNPRPTTPSWNSRKRRKIRHSILPCFAHRSALYPTKPPQHPHHLQQKPPPFPTHPTGTFPHATRHRQTPNQHQHSPQLHFRIPQHHLHHHLPHPLPALRTLSSSPPMFPFCPKHVRGTHQSIPPGWAPHSCTTLHIQQHLYTYPLTGHHTTSPPERPPSTLQLLHRHQTLPQSHSTFHSTTSHTTSHAANSLPPNHYHQYHYSVPTGASHSRRTANRATSGHAPTDHPADRSSSRSCSRRRAQFTPQQLIVSPHTILTHRVMTKKDHIFRFVSPLFNFCLDRPQCTMHLDRDLALPFNFHVDRSRFSNS